MTIAIIAKKENFLTHKIVNAIHVQKIAKLVKTPAAIAKPAKMVFI